MERLAFGLGETRVYELVERRVLYVLIISARRLDPDRAAAGFSLLP
jgi:hypothetical protein